MLVFNVLHNMLYIMTETPHVRHAAFWLPKTHDPGCVICHTVLSRHPSMCVGEMCSSFHRIKDPSLPIDLCTPHAPLPIYVHPLTLAPVQFYFQVAMSSLPGRIRPSILRTSLLVCSAKLRVRMVCGRIRARWGKNPLYKAKIPSERMVFARQSAALV